MARTFSVGELLAGDRAPCLRLRYGPEVTDAVELDREAVEQRKGEILAFCAGLPGADQGLSWRQVRAHTSNNGLYAKILIALGDHLGAWTMHPAPELPRLWRSIHPVILAPKKTKRPRGTPKPSRGDLEEDLKPCACCARPMGPADSTVHDLTASDYNEDLCRDCEHADCDPLGLGECQVDKPKGKEKVATPAEDELGLEDDEIDDFLKGFEL